MKVFDDKILEDLKTVKRQTEFLLENYPASRNNDFYLQLLWLKVFGKIDMPYLEWETIREYCSKLESVGRARRHIQNTEGRYSPTDPKIVARRRQKQETFRTRIHEL